jgi:ankyrin repeat protein
MLLQAKADVDAPPAKYDGRTALEGAAEHGRLHMVHLLMANSCHDGSHKAKYTKAANFATEEGHLAIAKLLRDSIESTAPSCSPEAEANEPEAFLEEVRQIRRADH